MGGGNSERSCFSCVCVSVSLKHCIKAYTSLFLMQLEVREKKSTALFGWAMDKRPIFPFFEAKSLDLFKCISPLIKYYMFNEKCTLKGAGLFDSKTRLQP